MAFSNKLLKKPINLLILLICNWKECNQEAINTGGKSTEIVQKVKYLGKVLTSDLKLKDHIEEKRITTQAILNTCLYAASNEVLSKIRMITILKFYKLAIIPPLWLWKMDPYSKGQTKFTQ